MFPEEMSELARRGQHIYEERLRAELEKTHHGEFLAIELDSGDYFLGRTLSDAMQACRAVHSDRLCYGMRVGHDAAFEIAAPFFDDPPPLSRSSRVPRPEENAVPPAQPERRQNVAR